MGTSDADQRAIRHVAARQHGVVTLPQLVRCGFSKKRIRGMLRRGELRRVHRGVYLVGHTWTQLTPFMAAALAGGPAAAVSHRSGTHLYKLLPYPAKPGPVHITVPHRHRVGDDRLVIHETRSLPHYEVRERDGIPVTSPLRTLIDFAGGDGADDELERAIAEAFALGLVNKRMLQRAVEGARGRRGIARIQTLIGADRRPSRTRSNPERALRRLLLAAGVDDFETNVRIGPWEVDFYWCELAFVVEVDAYATHSSPWAFDRDRRKTTDLEDRGLKVHRVTDFQIDAEPEVVVAKIQARLRALDRLMGD